MGFNGKVENMQEQMGKVSRENGYSKNELKKY